MPRIALITTSYPDAMPGSEAAGSFVEDFALELARIVDVTVLAASETDSVENNERLTIRRFAVPRLPLSSLRPANPLDWPAIVAALRRGRRATLDMVGADRPDHILALWALPSGWWARSTDVSYSTWVLGSDVWTLGRIPVMRSVLASVLKAATHRFADGIQLAADVEQLSTRSCSFLASARRLPAPQSTSTTQSDGLKLAFLGRWHPNKGADLLMQALLSLGDEHWQSIHEVRIFGGGPLEDQVRRSADTLSAAGRPITIGGYLGKQEAANLISWADFLLLPSRIESIPVIFSDAMQLGTPIIATPVGDLPRLFEHYECGVLADAVTSEGLADALCAALFRDPRSFLTGVERARADFDTRFIVRQFLDAIGETTA
jgi:glycosyltransferase involved in cell wall biosynthesis